MTRWHLLSLLFFLAALTAGMEHVKAGFFDERLFFDTKSKTIIVSYTYWFDKEPKSKQPLKIETRLDTMLKHRQWQYDNQIK